MPVRDAPVDQSPARKAVGIDRATSYLSEEYETMRIILWLILGLAVAWLFRRLWPAIKSEPSTWLGENWQGRLVDRVKSRLPGGNGARPH